MRGICLHWALPHHPTPFVFFVLICDVWEICFILCKQRYKSKLLTLDLFVYINEAYLPCIASSQHTDKRDGMMG